MSAGEKSIYLILQTIHGVWSGTLPDEIVYPYAWTPRSNSYRSLDIKGFFCVRRRIIVGKGGGGNSL